MSFVFLTLMVIARQRIISPWSSSRAIANLKVIVSVRVVANKVIVSVRIIANPNGIAATCVASVMWFFCARPLY